jgi:ketosteroid isomerase-like protein
VSEQNIELIRRWVGIWADRDLVAMLTDDPESVAAVFEALHPEITVRWAERILSDQAYEGLEGAERAMTDWLEAWEEFEMTAEEFIEVGDTVVVEYRQVGRGKGSGAQVVMNVAQVYEVRDGKIASLDEYVTKAEALEAAAAGSS